MKSTEQIQATLKQENHENENTQNNEDEKQILSGTLSGLQTVFDYSKAVFTGTAAGASDLIHTTYNIITHPLDEVVYPLSSLVFDALIITAAQEYDHSLYSGSNINDLNMLHEVIQHKPQLYVDAVDRMLGRLNFAKEHVSSTAQEFSEASGPRRTEMITKTAFTVLAPGYFIKAAKVTTNLYRFGIPFNPPKFKPILNKGSGSIVNPPPSIKNLLVSDLRRMTDERILMYAITDKGKLFIAPRNHPNLIMRNYFGAELATSFIYHPELVRLEPVVAAGDLIVKAGYISNGKIKQGGIAAMDNQSGHYYPQGEHLGKLVETVFHNHGFEEFNRNYFIDVATLPVSKKRWEPRGTPKIIEDNIGKYPTFSELRFGSAIALNPDKHIERGVFMQPTAHMQETFAQKIFENDKNNNFKQEFSEMLSNIKSSFQTVSDYSEAVMTGTVEGVSDLVLTTYNMIAHPLDELLYPIATLAFDTAMITAAKNYDPSLYVTQDDKDINILYQIIQKAPEFYVNSHLRMQQRLETVNQQLYSTAEEFLEGSGPKRIEMISKFGSTILVPGYLVKGLKAVSSKYYFNTFSIPPKFRTDSGIKAPWLQTEKVNRLSIDDIRRDRTSYDLMYVITEDKKLIITEADYDHWHLGQGKPVYAAGDITLDKVNNIVKITEINSRSRSYVPQGKHLGNLVETIFQKNGFSEAKGTFTDWMKKTKSRFKPDIVSEGYGSSFFGTLLGGNAAFRTDTPFNITWPYIFSDLNSNDFLNFIPNAHAKEQDSDEQVLKDIKKILATLPSESDTIHYVKKVKKIEKLLENSMLDSNALNEQLSNIEKNNLNKIIEKSEAHFNKSFLEEFSNLMGDINAIFDKNAFADRHHRQGGSVANDPIPFGHTVFNVASFFNLKESGRISSTVSHSVHMLQGAAEIIESFDKEGLSAIFGSAVSFGSGNILSGFVGLMSLYGKKENPNAAVMGMIIGLAQQMAFMNRDLLEVMRMHSIALGIVDFHVVHGFLKMESLMNQHHREVKLLFEQIKKFLYIDLVYLETFKAAFEANTRYHVMHLICQADWQDALHRIKAETLNNPKSLSVIAFKNGISDLGYILDKVKRNGIARASEVLFTENGPLNYAKMSELLTIASPYVTKQIPKRFSDNYRLYTEQNIHLLVQYLKMISRKHGIKENLADLQKLYNPAALYDVAQASQLLMQTYRETYGYLGIPEDPVRLSLNVIMEGIYEFEQLCNVLPQFVEKIFLDYLEDIKQFSGEISELQNYIAFKYYRDHILPKIDNQLNKNLQTLEGLDSSKSSDFMSMTENPLWFKFQWTHTWLEAGRFGGCEGWDSMCCHPKHDRPCYIPTSDIEKTKRIYRATHQDRAKAIHQELMEYQRTINENFSDHFSHKNKAMIIENMRDVLLYNNKTYTWQNRPYYFMNNDVPLLAAAEQMTKIPEVLFELISLGGGQLKLTAKYDSNKGDVNLKVIWERDDGSLIDSELVFEQTTTEAPGHKYKLSPTESMHYLWYGGEVPTGNCGEYDPDLNRFSNAYDVEALNDYASRRVAADCNKKPYGKCHDFYRATVCMPYTTEVYGLFLNTLEVNTTVLNSWVSTQVKPELITKFENLLFQRKMEIRTDVQKEMARGFRAGSFQHLEIPAHLKQNLMNLFHRIDAVAHVIKMILSLLIDPQTLGQDSSWPNIFDGQDILRELDTPAESRIYLNSKLDFIHHVLTSRLPTIIEMIRKQPMNRYPFIHFKKEFNHYVEEVIKKEMMPNIIAESQPKDLYQLKQLISDIFPMLDTSVQAKLIDINPALKNIINLNNKNQLDSTHKPKVIFQEENRGHANTKDEMQDIEEPDEVIIDLDEVENDPIEQEPIQTSAASRPLPWISSVFSFGTRVITAMTSWSICATVHSSENTAETSIPLPKEKVAPETFSTFHQPQSLNDTLITVQYAARMLEKASILNFSWNKAFELTSEQERQLIGDQKKVNDLNKTLAKKQESRAYKNKVNADKFHDVHESIENARNCIKTALKTKKISESDLKTIARNIKRAEELMPKLTNKVIEHNIRKAHRKAELAQKRKDIKFSRTGRVGQEGVISCKVDSVEFEFGQTLLFSEVLCVPSRTHSNQSLAVVEAQKNPRGLLQ